MQTDIDTPGLNDNIDRTVERTALRKVRSLVEEQEQALVRQRRFQILVAGVFGRALAAWAVVHVTGSSERERQAEEAAQRACLLDVWAGKAKQLELDLIAKHPTPSRKEVADLMRSLRGESDAANSGACAKGGTARR